MNTYQGQSSWATVSGHPADPSFYHPAPAYEHPVPSRRKSTYLQLILAEFTLKYNVLQVRVARHDRPTVAGRALPPTARNTLQNRFLAHP
jgi:hypothetical protein